MDMFLIVALGPVLLPPSASDVNTVKTRVIFTERRIFTFPIKQTWLTNAPQRFWGVFVNTGNTSFGSLLVPGLTRKPHLI